MVGDAPSPQGVSLPSAFLEIQRLVSKRLLQMDKERRQILQVPGSPWIYIPAAAGGCLPAHSLTLHLCKTFVEVMQGVFNTPGSRMLSLNHLLTSFYLFPVLGVVLHPPGFPPFPLYIKLRLNQSSSITFLLRSPG